MVSTVVQRLKLSIVGAALAVTLVAVGGVVAVGNAIAATQLVASVNVNVRSGPGTNNPVIGYVSKGTVVSATGPAVSGQGSGTTWTPITYGGKTAYVATAYFKTVADTNSGSEGTGTTAARSGVSTTDVNVRTGPSTSYSVVGVLRRGTTVKLTGATSGEWLQFVFEGSNRWVHGSFIDTSGSSGSGEATLGQIRTTATLYVRAEGVYGAKVLTTLATNSVVDVTGKTTATYTEILYKGLTGWISSKYTTAVTASPLGSTGSSGLTAKQKAIVNYAIAQVGDDYVWGAEGPNAFDCSGLTLAAYRAAGISLPHYSRSQAALGTAVSKANLEPGDLIFWYSPISHVSVYIGDGQMVHARNTRVGVVQQSVDSYIRAGADYTFARRILTD